MKINDKLVVKIEKLVFGGEGIAKVNDMVIFVPMSIVGDILEVKIISIKKTYARALIEKIIEPSVNRINLDKISFEDFSGCDYAMMKYDYQIETKKEILKDIFYKIAKININNIDVVSSPNILNYRNKVAEPFTKIKGKIYTGFYKRKSHEIFISDTVNLRSKIATEINNKLLDKINSYRGTKKEFKVYNDISLSGFLKHCIIRNNTKDEIMLVVVVNSKGNIKNLIKVLEEMYDENRNLKSVYISVKEEKNNIIMGEKIKHIKGEKYIEENIFGINFKILPDSFFQINIEQTKNLYEYAIGLLGDYKDKVLIDAYSGTGTIAMIMSKIAKKVYALELVDSSVKSARITSKENNIDNIEFISGKVEDNIYKVMQKSKVDYIVFDPPRKGVDKISLDEVIKNKINKIIYISCNPATLARDIQYLNEKGYILENIKGFDMFPQTHHIETVALLSLKNIY